MSRTTVQYASDWRGVLFGCRLRVRGRRIKERRIERSCQGVGFPAVGETGNEEFVTETLRMAFASQKHEQAMHFGFGADNHLAAQNERGGQRAVKFGAVVIDGRIDGVEHSYFQDRAFGQRI